jgi:hypothetical protein
MNKFEEMFKDCVTIDDYNAKREEVKLELYSEWHKNGKPKTETQVGAVPKWVAELADLDSSGIAAKMKPSPNAKSNNNGQSQK